MTTPLLPGKGRPLGARNKPKPPALPRESLTPAPQYDRMRAPVWTQAPAAPARSGALDHQRIGSRGYRC